MFHTFHRMGAFQERAAFFNKLHPGGPPGRPKIHPKIHPKILSSRFAFHFKELSASQNHLAS
jgi:hypothetical protein